MTATQIAFSAIGVLMGLLGTLVGVIYSLFKQRAEVSEKELIRHDRRIQRIEDLHETKIDQLGTRLDKMEQTIKELSSNIHREKNIENSLNATLNGLLKHMELSEAQHERMILALNKEIK